MTAPDLRPVLVLGGTGFVGRALCETWVARSGPHSPRLRVATRRRSRAQTVQPLPQVDILEADVHDNRALDALVEGCSAVVNLVAVLQGDERRFEAIHVTLPQRLAAACQRQGVRRLVHVSALGATTDAPSRYLRSKARGEQVLQAAQLDLTLLRPSVIFGAHDRLLNLFAQLQRLAPVVPLAGAHAQLQPVWVGDVAAALAAVLDRPDSIGQTYECAGPEVLTLADLVRQAGRWAGCERPVVSLPQALGWAQALLMEWAPGEPLMSRDNLASLTVPNVATGRLPGLQALGIAAQPLSAIAPGYLRPDAGCARLDALRAVHR